MQFLRIMLKKPNGYWNNKKRIKHAALNATGRSDFCKKYPAAYKHACKLGMLDQLFPTNTVTPLGRKKYSYKEWTDKELKLALSHYKNRLEAQKEVGRKILKEAANRGILDIVLPRAKAENYSVESALALTKDFDSITEFQKQHSGAYGFLQDNGQLDKLHVILPPKKLKPDIYWTEKRLSELSIKYNGNLAALRNKHPGAYARILKNPELSQKLFPNRKRHNYWNIETAKELALECEHQTELRARNQKAYEILRDAGILEDLLPPKPSKWTRETLKELVHEGKFEQRTEFFRAFPGAYTSALQLGLIDAWFPTKDPMSLEYAVELTKNCGTRTELHKKSLTAYLLIHEAGLMDQYLPLNTKRWTREGVKLAASECQSRAEFMRKYPGAYGAATKGGYLDGICAHMEYRGPSDRDSVYLWRSERELFKGKQVYKVGVSSSRIGDFRIKQVARSAGIKAHIIRLVKTRTNAYEIEAILLSLGDDPQFTGRDGATEFRAMDDSELKLALEIIDTYREGTEEINHPLIVDGTLEPRTNPKKDITLYRWVHVDGESIEANRHEMADMLGVGQSSMSNVINSKINHVKGWIVDNGDTDRIKSIEKLVKHKTFWTKKACAEEAKKYTKRVDFQKGSKGASLYAYRRGWIDEICAHMESAKRPDWTPDELRAELVKYKYLNDARLHCPNALNAARKRGILNEVAPHLKRIIDNTWQPDELIKYAKRFKSRKELRESGPKGMSAYGAIKYRKLQKQAFLHMKKKRQWDMPSALKAAKNYTSRSKFARGPDGAAYNLLRRKGMLDEACTHMGKKEI